MSSRAGSAAEFDRFYAQTAHRLVRQVALMTGDLAEAEDATQEAFAHAWLRWTTVRECRSPEAWVRTVARRLAVSRWRRTRNASMAWARRGPARAPHEPDPEHVALVVALRSLPEAQRVAIVLHHLADLTVERVAEETGSSVSAVKQQLVRGRAALAARLGEGAEQDPDLVRWGGPT